ncbi:hypothetical protein DSO57_1035430 [Entomophthora muscae]|uniref:Uncharacterized protein n=1 Tax=Entomophthora muscae TaxID=34485 RepID=A0ACC2TY80_9FUNG|nr:hypothetical protein DSO57_1035430 [Entomophthora muscae]
MKYPPFDAAIRLIHNVRYVKGWLIERPLCIRASLETWLQHNGFVLYQNTVIPLPAFNAMSAQGFFQEPP